MPIVRGVLLRFFLLTFAITWTAWIAAAAIPARVSFPLRNLLIPAGVFAPAAAALFFTARTDGRAGVQALLQRIGHWRVQVRWYVFAVGYVAALKLSVTFIQRIATGTWPRFGDTPWYLMIGAITMSMWVQAGEEIGWRGYALPRLAERIGLAGASIVVGVIWAAWHLPLFWFPASDTFGQSFPMYLLQVSALSVAMAWLYWRTGGSLLLVMLMHAAVNNTKDIVPSAAPASAHMFSLGGTLVGWLTVALLWLAAAYFLFRMRGNNAKVVRQETPGF